MTATLMTGCRFQGLVQCLLRTCCLGRRQGGRACPVALVQVPVLEVVLWNSLSSPVKHQHAPKPVVTPLKHRSHIAQQAQETLFGVNNRHQARRQDCHRLMHLVEARLACLDFIRPALFSSWRFVQPHIALDDCSALTCAPTS